MEEKEKNERYSKICEAIAALKKNIDDAMSYSLPYDHYQAQLDELQSEKDKMEADQFTAEETIAAKEVQSDAPFPEEGIVQPQVAQHIGNSVNDHSNDIHDIGEVEHNLILSLRQMIRYAISKELNHD